MAEIVSELLGTAPKPRTIKPKLRVLGTGTQEHYYGGRRNKVRNDVRKARELITALKVRVVEVPVRFVEAIDRNKYTGSHLRDLRAERGVGRPPRVKAERMARLVRA